MTILTFLATWTLRSAAVALAAAGLLKLFRISDPSVRLAAWTAALFGSLLIPVLTLTLPAVSLPAALTYELPRTGPRMDFQRLAIPPAATRIVEDATPAGGSGSRSAVSWPSFLLAGYLLGAGALMLRLGTGLLMSRRLILRSRPTEHRLPGGLAVLESGEMGVPAALGAIRPVVVLPRDWREWDASKLQAIVAHEQSHVRRHDPAVQLLSAIHRALLWHSPLSWWMHKQIVRLAEDASDDAALAAVRDRVSYAETLLQFMQRGRKIAYWEGVAMARYGKAENRIHRILDGTAISRGLTRLRLTSILLIGVPVVMLAAAVAPVPPRPPAPPQAPAAPGAPADPGSPAVPAEAPQAPEPPEAPAPPSPGKVSQYIVVSGDSWSGSWDGRDERKYKKWRAQYGSHYAFFRKDGRDYIVTDAHTMQQFDDAMAPQREVNRQQEEVNSHQEQVNSQQERVNSHQEDVNRAQEDVNREQGLVNDGSGNQDRVNRMQAAVNGRQQTVNAEQEKVNDKQAVVNREQEAVNRVQERASAQVEKALQAVFTTAVHDGLAHEIR